MVEDEMHIKFIEKKIYVKLIMNLTFVLFFMRPGGVTEVESSIHIDFTPLNFDIDLTVYRKGSHLMNPDNE